MVLRIWGLETLAKFVVAYVFPEKQRRGQLPDT